MKHMMNFLQSTPKWTLGLPVGVVLFFALGLTYWAALGFPSMSPN